MAERLNANLILIVSAAVFTVLAALLAKLESIPHYGIIKVMAIESFKDKLSEAINYGQKTKQTQKLLPAELHQKAQIKLAVLGAATSLNDLSELRGNRFESLKGSRAGEFSLRINDQYRICFEWREGNAYNVEIVDYH